MWVLLWGGTLWYSLTPRISSHLSSNAYNFIFVFLQRHYFSWFLKVILKCGLFYFEYWELNSRSYTCKASSFTTKLHPQLFHSLYVNSIFSPSTVCFGGKGLRQCQYIASNSGSSQVILSVHSRYIVCLSVWDDGRWSLLASGSCCRQDWLRTPDPSAFTPSAHHHAPLELGFILFYFWSWGLRQEHWTSTHSDTKIHPSQQCNCFNVVLNFVCFITWLLFQHYISTVHII